MWYASRRPEGILSLPFLVGGTMLAMYGPQLLALSADPTLPSHGVDRLILITTGCILALTWGYQSPNRCKLSFRAPSDDELELTAWFVSLVGVFGLILLSRVPDAERAIRSPTGIIVIIDFLAKNLQIGFGIAALCWLRRRTPATWTILLLDSVFILYRLVVVSKRTVVVETAIAIAVALWLTRRKRTPTWLGVAAIPFMFVIIAFGNQYREATSDGLGQYGALEIALPRRLAAAREVMSDLDFRKTLRVVGCYELRNAVMDIEAKTRTRDFTYLKLEYNQTVRIFLPRSVFGEWRDAFMFELPDDAYRVYGYVRKRGTPPTGMATSYLGFWYLGIFEFWVIGFFVASLMSRAEAGSMFAMCIWPHLLMRSMLSVTHAVDRLPTAFVGVLIVVLPCCILARRIVDNRARRPTRVLE